MGREGGVPGLNEERKGIVWEVERGVGGPHARELSGRWDGEREGRGMGVKRENSETASHVLKKMSCQAGLDNYCHLWGVSVQENQIIMMS